MFDPLLWLIAFLVFSAVVLLTLGLPGFWFGATHGLLDREMQSGEVALEELLDS